MTESSELIATTAYFAYFLTGLSVLYFLAYVLASWLSFRLHEYRFVPYLNKLSPALQNGMGITAGLITPFCSCSTIPIFLGLLESRLPRRTAMSFLIASPLVNPPAFFLSLALLGWPITALYLVASILIAFVGGVLLAQDRFHNDIKDFLFMQNDPGETFAWKRTSVNALRFVISLIPALLIAGLAAASLRVWGLPEMLQVNSDNYPLWAIPAASMAGGLLYADLAMIIPVANEALVQALPASIVLPFLMAASGVGIPSLILLSRIFSTRLMLVYMLSIFTMISFVGVVSRWWLQ